jgi:hypothetical protein
MSLQAIVLLGMGGFTCVEATGAVFGVESDGTFARAHANTLVTNTARTSRIGQVSG